jgi:hypothetical protein
LGSEAEAVWEAYSTFVHLVRSGYLVYVHAVAGEKLALLWTRDLEMGYGKVASLARPFEIEQLALNQSWILRRVSVCG